MLKTRRSASIQGCLLSYFSAPHFFFCFKPTGGLQLMEIGDVQKKDIVDHPENYTLLTTLDEGLCQDALWPPMRLILPGSSFLSVALSLFQGCGGGLKKRGGAWGRPLRLSSVRTASGRWWPSSVPGRQKTSAHLIVELLLSILVFLHMFCVFGEF